MNSNPLSNVHIQRNRRTRGDWASFAPHRQRVTELILSSAGEGNRSLGILGAGNGNDFDLAEIAARFGPITLVDLDGEAIQHCLDTQASGIAGQIETRSGVDLSGVMSLLSRDPPELDRAIAGAGEPIEGLGPFDVVVSTCLLTQMIDTAVAALGGDHPRLIELMLAIRDGHLRRLGQMTAAGGSAILITDFVSSDTLPELKQVADHELESLLAGAINASNFFTGVNPGVLVRQFASIGGGQAELQMPWRWQMGDRVYGVCAVSLGRFDYAEGVSAGSPG